ncbi:unnamed protein product [Urochloa decumbens]|uniref:non-specific serine/threonine protein kinase n=1 Tax=Urochloa decumbens TaxID=240449 RepID=A0ABC8VWL0_9POAL
MAYRNRRDPLLLLLAAAHLCFMSPDTTVAVSFSYDFSKASDQAQLWYANGNSSAAGDGISITKMKTWSTGRVAYKEAVRLWDDHRTGKVASFQTNFSFSINRRNGSEGGGDGMAFFIGPFPPSLPPDSDGAFLGLFTRNRQRQPTVGVEFDTFWNPNQGIELDPTDITTDHIGIDVGSISNCISYTKGLAYGSLSSGTMEAGITYDAGSKLMVVTLRLANGTTVSVQAKVDFKDAGLPPDAAVGFSAATGGLMESHQLLSWSFSSSIEPSRKTSTRLWVILLISAASASLAGLVAALLYYGTMRRPRRSHSFQIDLQVARKFSYNELSAATNNFSKDRKLGAGAFGEVYMGELQDPRMPPVVAVKKLTRLMEQTRKDYVTEINTLGQLSHRNLVKLLGWCSGGGELLLVYELVTNGSLEEHLHGPERPLLGWPERYKIVLGVGAAIDYLHTGYLKRILHRDIKLSNVMLDDAFDAKLGDFGLVRQVDPEQGDLGGTCMIGTRVYMDPICISSDTVSTASDMYSFGVLLLEIAAGVKPAEVQVAAGGGHLSNTLVETVRESYARGAVLEMADKRLEGNFNKSQMERVLAVGRLCIQLERQHRPSIKKAVNLLSDLSLPVPQVGCI